jgi:hypothetical protein
MFLGMTPPAVARAALHDEVDLTFRESELQGNSGLFISASQPFDVSVQPRRQISDPLRVPDEQVNIVTDSMVEGEHYARTAAEHCMK